METERTSERDRPLRLILIVVASILIIPLVLMAVMMPMMWMVGGMETGGAVSMSPVWGIGMMLVFLLIVLGVDTHSIARPLRQESAAGTRQSKNSESRMLVVNCHKKSSNSGGKRSKKRTNRIYHTDDKH